MSPAPQIRSTDRPVRQLVAAFALRKRSRELARRSRRCRASAPPRSRPPRNAVSMRVADRLPDASPTCRWMPRSATISTSRSASSRYTSTPLLCSVSHTRMRPNTSSARSRGEACEHARHRTAPGSIAEHDLAGVTRLGLPRSRARCDRAPSGGTRAARRRGRSRSVTPRIASAVARASRTPTSRPMRRRRRSRRRRPTIRHRRRSRHRPSHRRRSDEHGRPRRVRPACTAQPADRAGSRATPTIAAPIAIAIEPEHAPRDPPRQRAADRRAAELAEDRLQHAARPRQHDER